MKQRYFFFWIMIFISINIFSQEQNTHEQIKALKTAFITERLSFTSSQAESFWPIYNSYDKRFHDLRKKRRTQIYHEIRNNWEQLSNEQAMILLELYFSIESEEIKIERERMHALRNVISPKEIITLKIAEEDFKTELLKRYRAGKVEK